MTRKTRAAGAITCCALALMLAACSAPQTAPEAWLPAPDVLELKANPNRTANGYVIEAKLERGRGPVGTVLVERGTLPTQRVTTGTLGTIPAAGVQEIRYGGQFDMGSATPAQAYTGTLSVTVNYN